MGLWSAQAKVECIGKRAAWPWGRDSRVLNIPLAEPDRTHSFVCLPSAWGSVDGFFVFPHIEEGSFTVTPADVHE